MLVVSWLGERACLGPSPGWAIVSVDDFRPGILVQASCILARRHCWTRSLSHAQQHELSRCIIDYSFLQAVHCSAVARPTNVCARTAVPRLQPVLAVCDSNGACACLCKQFLCKLVMMSMLSLVLVMLTSLKAPMALLPSGSQGGHCVTTVQSPEWGLFTVCYMHHTVRIRILYGYKAPWLVGFTCVTATSPSCPAAVLLCHTCTKRIQSALAHPNNTESPPYLNRSMLCGCHRSGQNTLEGWGQGWQRKHVDVDVSHRLISQGI